jgi:hypothetical protein
LCTSWQYRGRTGASVSSSRPSPRPCRRVQGIRADAFEGSRGPAPQSIVQAIWHTRHVPACLCALCIQSAPTDPGVSKISSPASRCKVGALQHLWRNAYGPISPQPYLTQSTSHDRAHLCGRHTRSSPSGAHLYAFTSPAETCMIPPVKDIRRHTPRAAG